MRYWIILALVLTSLPAVHVAEASESRSLTFEQVIVNVLQRNPQLGVNDLEAQAAASRIRQARQVIPFEMKFGLENFAGSGVQRGVNQLETTLSLVKVLELGRKASSRGDLAQQKARLLSNKQDSLRLDLLAKAAEQFIHVVVDQHRLRIGQNQLALVKRTYEIVTQRVNAGRSHVAEQRRVAIALIRAEIEREHAEHELISSRVRLASYWGETHPRFTLLNADLFRLPAVASFEQLETQLTNNPNLIRFATEERVAQARLRLAQSRRTPNLELSAGVRYFSDPSDAALVMSASIPFGSGSRAKPHIDEMQYLLRRDPLRHEQQRLALYTSLFDIYQELLHARTAFEALSKKIIPQAERVAEDYEQGYKSGRFSLLELNAAQQVLLDARLETVITAANYHRYRIEIERLTGAQLRSGVKP